MKRLALIVALSFVALPVMAQGTFTFGPSGGSIYGGPPTSYSGTYQNNSGNLSDIANQQLQRFQTAPTQRSVTCMNYGIQTVCQ